MNQPLILLIILLSVVCLSCNRSGTSFQNTCCNGEVEIEGDASFRAHLGATDSFGHLMNTIFAPNMITPNDDHINDFFFFSTLNFEIQELTICNSLRKPLVTITEEPFKWDGTVSGEMCNEGKYWAEVTLLNSNGGSGKASIRFCMVKCIDADVDLGKCRFGDEIHPRFGDISPTRDRIGCD